MYAGDKGIYINPRSANVFDDYIIKTGEKRNMLKAIFQVVAWEQSQSSKNSQRSSIQSSSDR